MLTQDKWIWHGFPGHFCAARSCFFRLCTEIGDVFISTVGAYEPSKELIEAGLEKKGEWMDVGVNRKFETMVFMIKDRCKSEKCGCGQPKLYNYDLSCHGCNTAKEAREMHMERCMEWAEKDGIVPQETIEQMEEYEEHYYEDD